jgi:hypothetical protein
MFGIIYDYLVQILAIGFIICPFGNFGVIPRFGILYKEQSGNPDSEVELMNQNFGILSLLKILTNFSFISTNLLKF